MQILSDGCRERIKEGCCQREELGLADRLAVGAGVSRGGGWGVERGTPAALKDYGVEKRNWRAPAKKYPHRHRASPQTPANGDRRSQGDPNMPE